ncbi:hypothetical protein [Kitasatospora kifunensis]|uniref:Uncharacterized protein n=1 Tax=Kitasatospora kifunensis TaxID=58351 RepID=A0A7W7QYM7_KITKI|nr:hypothetical protein [Kitasatospora kifunensis]MBB4921949.1 hypothetical protein [Kitasatospora kifunensis]
MTVTPAAEAHAAGLELDIEQAQLVTIAGANAAAVFTAAGQWLREHQDTATVLGVDFDMQDGDADGDGLPDAVLRLTTLIAGLRSPARSA